MGLKEPQVKRYSICADCHEWNADKGDFDYEVFIGTIYEATSYAYKKYGKYCTIQELPPCEPS